MEPITVSVDYLLEDFERSLRYIRERNALHRYLPLITAAAIFLLMLFILIALRDPSDEKSLWYSIFAATLPALIVGGAVLFTRGVIDPWFTKRTIRKQIAASPMLRERNDIQFSEIGIEGTTFLGSQVTKWPAVIAAVETDTDFLFFTGAKFAIFVPKRAFEHPDDVQSVRSLVAERLGDKAQLN